MNTPCNHWVTGLISNSTGFCPYCEIDALKAENDKLSDLWSQMKAERDELRAKLAAYELAKNDAKTLARGIEP